MFIFDPTESIGVIIERTMAGHFMTSLDMAGFQILLMHLDKDTQAALGKLHIITSYSIIYLEFEMLHTLHGDFPYQIHKFPAGQE